MKNQDNRSKADVNPWLDATGSPQASLAQAGLELRRKAEALARERTARTPDDSATLSADEIRDTLHELQVHQIELEMQNDELRKAQSEIEAGRARYFDLYDLAPVGYITVGEKGLILEANLTAATLLGVNRAALVRQPLTRFILKEDQDLYYLHRKRLFATGEPQECELRLIKPDGAILWAHLTETAAQAEDGAPVCRVLLSNITGRRQMEEDLQRSERFFRQVFEESPVGRCLVGVDGRIVKANHAFCALLGRSAPELGALSFLEITHPEDREASSEGVRQLLDGTLDRLDLEKRYLTSEQQTVWASVRVGLLHDRAGTPLHFSVYAQDITERKQSEMAMLARDEQLRSIASNIPGAIYQFVLRQDGTFEIPFMSEGARLLFGRPVAELQYPAYLFDDVHPEDVPGLWASIEASAKDLTPWNAEFRLVSKTVPLRWLRGTSKPVLLPEGDICWNGVMLDITEQKRGDEQTRLQHNLALALTAASDLQQGLRLCLETALQGSGLDAGGFYLLDETSGGLDFLVPQGLSSEFVHAVSRYEATSDHTRSVMAGLPVYARLEDLGLSLSEAERQEGLRFTASIPLHHEGKVIGCMNVASHTADDLSPANRQVLETIAAAATQAISRLRAEERLRAGETLLNESQRLSKVGGWEWDIIRQTMVWTEETYRLHDLSAQEVAPGADEHIRRSAACYGPEHQATILAAFRGCVERGEAYDLEVPFTSVKGRSMWVRTTAQAVWEGNRITKVVGNLMDITERKRLEAQRAAAFDALQHEKDALKRWQSLTVGRELAMVELKKEVNALLKQAGQPEAYTIVDGKTE